ncbi:hypothetical protein A2230_03080 [candidate division WOR-1 bacterium RIFOXYA2_FULL_36_21]|uniref:Addiction module toxin RelE n=1 Tax=candidate division WOR-1 bacterium RIFOXYB2_FULL_36_35 TaxID=1802578 RepID=A0A1F4S2V0_UNCSA|nr:MAG: hypothetical protein A2230_03080 [candidate division WOR-1 bacterium RIFOXYA2_FULL_36_21]OGC14063.1 MAG: hypothetical protein A2290_07005 [candidate division WOR-1 bacterium RIFOXYB2_FULL_36_35]OGC16760.1 MAG: hypothetical protein A2282_04080 [candidate division WOR-1 bacterium RIFOXYA12_FULL_36_13]
MEYFFTRKSEKEFLKLSHNIQKKIIEKVEFYLSLPNPLNYAKRLSGLDDPTFRFRVDDYRVVFDLEKDNRITILRVGHRKDIYKGF